MREHYNDSETKRRKEEFERKRKAAVREADQKKKERFEKNYPNRE